MTFQNNMPSEDFLTSGTPREEQKEPLYDQYMRYMKQYESKKEEPPIPSQKFSHVSIDPSFLKIYNQKKELLIKKVTVYFNEQTPTTRYLIVFAGGVMVGMVILYCIPAVINALIQFANFLKDSITTDSPPSDNSSNSNNSSPSSYPPDGKKPDIQLTWVQLIVLACLRAAYLYFTGSY